MAPIFSTFSKVMLDHEASVFMKGSTQTSTLARCSWRAYVDISLSLGQPPGERWPNGKWADAQEGMQSCMAACTPHARTRGARIPFGSEPRPPLALVGRATEGEAKYVDQVPPRFYPRNR